MKTRRMLKEQAEKEHKGRKSREKSSKQRSPKAKAPKNKRARSPSSSSSSSPEPQPKKAKRNRTQSRTTDSPSPKKKVRKDEAAKKSPKKTRAKKDSVLKSKPSPAKSRSPSSKSKWKNKGDSSPKKMKTVRMSGSVPVDESFPLSGYHVLEEAGKVYSATLNQTKVSTNNNKYYILQVLESNDKRQYWFWTRWGRVGAKGQSSNFPCRSKEIAIRQYNSKFHDKHVIGEYRHLQLKYEDEDEVDDKKDKKTEEPIKQRAKDFTQSKLHANIKNLIKLIFDTDMMDRQMKQIGYDSEKMPLGKLSKETIRRGYQALKELMEQIERKKPREDLIEELNNTFYSYIPHDFGFSKMQHHILRSKKQVQDKLQMLESLQNITVARKLIKTNEEDTNIIDQNYAKLDREVDVINTSSREYQIIEEYVNNTHAKTHSTYSLQIENVFKLSKKQQNDRYMEEIGNKMLLWHGSRLTNYVGILSQGLRIAPPEAPVTGYMFGKGVYFADMVSKSANYCFTNPFNNTGLMLLCEVALGQMNEKFQADYYADHLPPGKNSTKGVGKTYPPQESYVDLHGVKVPLGEPHTDSGLKSSLLYNEYIVYHVAQVKLKYLLRVKFNYKNR